ncbi:MAG: glycoside hydrolase family 13 protein [Oscillospiraceae bacterium]|nr:glycoside hydrolase family 13 protein [Oscillospiraceae bacterium]
MSIYNSVNPDYKTPFGAVKTNETVSFTVHVPKKFPAATPLLVLRDGDGNLFDAVPMGFLGSSLSSNHFNCKIELKEPAVYFYCFEIVSGGEKYTIRRGEDGAAKFCEDGGLWQLTVYDENMKTPEFLKGGIMYQIFPDRFYNSGEPKENVPDDRMLRSDWGGMPIWRPNHEGEVLNNDYFGGDLLGIEQKLDYLESLGVTCIYLNPIFEAHANHRYNTADYMRIDPLLGTNGDFERLAKKAKERGISIILDGVFSHTGSDSVYFNKKGRYEGGAYNDPESPYREWYMFKNYPHDYESWWGFITMPNVDETNPAYIEYICGENGVLKKWLKAGASGFRLDVADELPDVFIDALNECVKSYDPDCAVIGEVWEDASTKVSYGVRRRYLLGKQMDSVMNYPFADAILNYIQWGIGDAFLALIMQILENYPQPVVNALMNFISTHDTARAITVLAGPPPADNGRDWQERHHHLNEQDYERGLKLFKLASILQFGLPGIPCVYYGDEAGLSGYRDPFNRCCYPWGHENTDLVRFTASLGKMRKDYPIFTEASFIPITFHRDICVFARKKGDTAIVFAVNRILEDRRVDLPLAFKDPRPLVVSGPYENGVLGGYSGVVLAAKI